MGSHKWAWDSDSCVGDSQQTAYQIHLLCSARVKQQLPAVMEEKTLSFPCLLQWSQSVQTLPKNGAVRRCQIQAVRTGPCPLGEHRSPTAPGCRFPGRVAGAGSASSLSSAGVCSALPSLKEPWQQLFPGGWCFSWAAGASWAAGVLPPQPQPQGDELDLLTKFKNE